MTGDGPLLTDWSLYWKFLFVIIIILTLLRVILYLDYHYYYCCMNIIIQAPTLYMMMWGNNKFKNGLHSYRYIYIFLIQYTCQNDR